MEGDLHRAAALGRDVALQLGEQSFGAEGFEDRETLPCPRGGLPGRALGRQRRHGAHRVSRRPDGPTGGPRRGDRPGRPLLPGVGRAGAAGRARRTHGVVATRHHELWWELPPAPVGDGFMAVSLPRAEDMETVPAWLELDDVPESVPAMWSSVASHLRHGDPGPAPGEGAAPGPPGSPGRRVGWARRRCPVAAWRGPAAARPDRPDRRRPIGAVGGPTVRRPPRPRRRHGRQGRVDAAARWRAPGPTRVLRPVERAQAIRRARFSEPRWRPDPARPAPTRRRGDRGEPAARAGPARTGRSRPGAGRRPAGLGLHHRSRAFWRSGQPGRIRRRRRGRGRVGRLEGRRPAVLRRRHRRSTHRPDGGGCLPARAGSGRALDARCVDVGRELGLGRPDLPVPGGLAVAQPHARPVEAPAPPFGADTARVLSELGIDP